MSWDAVLFGELVFPATGVGSWQRATASIARAGWPSMLAPADDADGAEHGTVADVLARFEEFSARALGDGPYFLEVGIEGSTVTLRGMLQEDDYREVLEQVVGLLSAAARGGATGRLRVRSLQGLAGGGVEISRGRIEAQELTAEEEEGMREVVALATQKANASKGRLTPDARRRIAGREKARARAAQARPARGRSKAAKPPPARKSPAKKKASAGPKRAKKASKRR